MEIVSAVAALILSASAFGADPAVAWRQVKDTGDGIVVFEEPRTQGTEIAFKVTGAVAAPLGKVASILSDVTRAKEWVNDLDECRVLRRFSAGHDVVYGSLIMPSSIRDRDFVVERQIRVGGDRRTITFELGPGSVPVPRSKKRVRGLLHDSRVVLSSTAGSASTEVELEVHFDPKSLVSSWIARMYRQDWPVYVLRRLRNQAIKEDIRIDPFFRLENP